MNGQAGKGDTYRPVDRKKYDEGYDRIFGKTPERIQTWYACPACGKGGVNYRNPICPKCGYDHEKET